MAPTQQSMLSGWQRSQAPYSAPVGGGMGAGGSYFSSGASGGTTPRGLSYTQHSGAQFGGRGSGDLYSGMSSLPTPVSEQSMGSGQSSLAGYSQSAQLSGSLPPRGQQVQQYDLANPSSQYPPQAGTYGQQPQTYPHPSSVLSYDPQTTPNPIKSDTSGYSDSPNLYHPPPPQNAYPGAENFSSADLPLGSGMLNREYPGPAAYQQQQPPQPQSQEPGGYGEMPGAEQEHHIAGYPSHQHDAKSQQPAAYPTPQHQTSPTEQLRDHG